MTATWMVDLLLRATVILGLAWVLTEILRRQTAALRHLVWTLALGSLLLLPAAWGILPRRAALGPAVNAATAVLQTVNARSAALPRAHEFPWIVAIWCLGCALVLLRWMRGALRTTRLMRRTSDAAYARIPMKELRGRIRVLESSDTSVALVWGLWRPVVILPDEAAGWEPARLRAVLAHELAHVKRWDLATHLLAQFACAIYWFHPLAWLAFHRLRQERERACDDAVLGEGISGPEYAGYLIDLVRSLAAQPPAGAPAMAEARDLEVRVRAILDPAQSRRAPGRRSTLAMALAAAVLVLAMASFRAKAQAAGALFGTVVDGNGAVIARAQVMTRNLETGTQSFAVADMAGHYSFATLPPGQYLLTISVPGFDTYETQVAVGGQPTPRLDMLHVGGVKQAITISGRRTPPLASGPAQRVRIRVGGNVQTLKPLVTPAPEYPEALQQRGVHGAVVLRASVDKLGLVTGAQVVNGTQVDPALAAIALDAVKTWTYTPALLDGEPVATDITITLNFELPQ